MAHAAQVCYWDGSTDTDWATNANWTGVAAEQPEADGKRPHWITKVRKVSRQRQEWRIARAGRLPTALSTCYISRAPIRVGLARRPCRAAAHPTR